MPSGFHPYASLLAVDIVWLMIDVSDPDLCRVGSDVLCWIESVGEGDPPPGGMTTPGYQAGALDTGGLGNGLIAADMRSGDPSNDPEWLALDTNGLVEGKVNDYGLEESLEGTSGFRDVSSALDDSSPDYSIFWPLALRER